MSDTFIDLNTPATDGTPLSSLPRGLVRPPQHILDHVTREQARLGPDYTDTYAKLTLNYQTLAWYYLGREVAYRSTPEGVEVLAIGMEEVAEFLRNTPQEQRRDVHVMQP